MNLIISSIIKLTLNQHTTGMKWILIILPLFLDGLQGQAIPNYWARYLALLFRTAERVHAPKHTNLPFLSR